MANLPTLYIDIDGVLLVDEHHMAEGAPEFIRYAIDNFDVYWLSTLVMNGKADRAIGYIQATTDEYLIPYLEDFHSPTWWKNKTEVIDFDKDFLWFGHNKFDYEQDVLKQHGVSDKWIEVDLRKRPDQLVYELKRLKSIAK